MATVNVVFTEVSGGSAGGGTKPVPDATPVVAEEITSSATSASSSNASPSGTGFCVITVSGGDVWVKFGSATTAAAGSDWLILEGQTRDFKVAKGTKVAVIDA